MDQQRSRATGRGTLECGKEAACEDVAYSCLNCGCYRACAVALAYVDVDSAL